MSIRRHAVRLARRFLQSPQGAESRARIEDPEVLLTLAQAEMTTRHAQNRARAVEALSQKNKLESMVRETERKVAALHDRARIARDRGDEESASQVMREEVSYRDVLDTARKSLEQALLTAEAVKLAIRREEDVIRRKTAEMTALRTQWKLVQIERALTISLAQLTASGDEPLTRERVSERHRRSRELAVEVITQKNYLASLANDTQQRAEYLRQSAESAGRAGQDDEERLLLRELEQQEAIRAATEAALGRANAVATRARALLDDEALRVRALHEVGSPTAIAASADLATRIAGESADRPQTFFERHRLLLIALGIAALLLLVGFFL